MAIRFIGRGPGGAASLFSLVLFFLASAVSAFDPNTGDLSKDESTDIRIVAYNTKRNFIWESGTDGEYERVLQALDPDIIVFEEIYWQVTIDQIEGRLDSILGGTWTAWTGKYSSFYVGGDWVLDVCNAVASRWPLSMERWDTSPNASTRGVTMALVDLPDATYRRDFYIMGNHFKSGSDSGDEDQRQESADANAAWLGDARDATEAEHDYISLETDTPVVILGDFNLIDDIQPDVTIRTGAIQDTGTFGPAVKGDWDGSDLTDAYPDDPWSDDHDTWPSDVSNPYRRFDRHYYTDSVVMVANSFILNTRNMTASQRAAAGVYQYDTEDASDHLPVIVDYRMAVKATPTPAPLPVTPTPVDLLTNGGFEDWTGGSPDGWDLESSASASVAQASSPVHSGSSSAALTTIGAPGYYGKGIYQAVYTVDPGDRFLFSAWVYSIEDSGMGISGNWWDGSSADYWSTVRAAGSGEWEKLEIITGPAPSGVVNLRVIIRGFRESALCGYADGASLELLAAVTPSPPPPSPTPSPPSNLLENGGFEAWENVRTVGSWSSESSIAAAQEFEEVFEGNYSMELSTTTSPGSYGKGYYQDIAVTEGETYTFSARIFSETSSALGIVLSWWDGSTSDFQPTVYNSGLAGWEKLSWSGTAPAGTVSARLYVRGFLDSDVCGYADSARFWTYEITPVPTPTASATPPPTATPSASPSASPSPVPPTPPSFSGAVPGDYDGDGTSDIALFRPSSGLWLVRGLTKAWFGAGSDEVVPSDYDGDGTWEAAVFRPGSGKWLVRGVTNAFYGVSTDLPVPADYDGDGTADIALFRPALGKWLVRNGLQVYYGFSTDVLVPADYGGDGTTDMAVFRPSNGKWLVRGTTSAYYGFATDTVVPGDYTGDGAADMAVFRPGSGKWLVRNGPTAYFGNSSDTVQPADYDGDGTWDFAVFRSASGKWLVRGTTSAYYGASTDLPVTNP